MLRTSPGRALTLTVAVAVLAALAAIGVPATAWAAAFVAPPTRLYMLPAGGSPITLPADFPVVPAGTLLFDGSTDLISQDLRKVVIDSAESGCNPGPSWSESGCTAVQLDVAHGLLDFTSPPTAQDDSDSTLDVYQLPSGALVRDMDSADDLPAKVTALVGTTAQVNQALATLRYTPDNGYSYNGSNPETLHLAVGPGDGGSTASADVQIRVQDINDFPELETPDGPFDVAPGADVLLGAPADWDVTDEDNDDATDEDGAIDGPGQEMILIAWSTCGTFELQGGSFTMEDDLEALVADAFDFDDPPTAPQQAILTAFMALIPDDIEDTPIATGNPFTPTTFFAGLADGIDEVNYALDQVTFHAVVPGTATPLASQTCKLNTFVTDLGNNGLPLQYLGDPPTGVEVPFFGVDLDTNWIPGFEQTLIKVGDGTQIDVTLPSDTTVTEPGTGSIPVTISPAEHPAFAVTVSSTPTGGATSGTDYTAITSLVVPIAENAVSASIPVDALDDAVYDPGEGYTLTLTLPATPPPGYTLTSTDPTAAVTITDDDPPPPTPVTVTIDQAAGQADPTSASPVVFTVVFSEQVSGFDSADVVLSGTAGATTAVVSPVGPASTFTVEVSGMAGSGTVIAAVLAGAVTDSDELPSAASTSTDNVVNYELPPVDAEAPTVTIDQAAAQADPTSASPVVFTVVFSEQVSGFDSADVVLSGTAGPTTAVVSPAGPATTYTVEVSGMAGSGTVIAAVLAGAAQDAASNASAASTSTDNVVSYELPPVDAEAPTVTIDQAAAQADPTSASPVVFTVVFSEQVSGFDVADVVLSGTAGATTAVVSPVGPATTFTVEVSGMAGSGTVIAAVLAGAAQDAASNASAASTSTDNVVNYDTIPPSVVINQAAGQADPTSVSPVVFTVVFNEAVTGFQAGDVALSGSAGATTAVVSSAGSPNSYTVEVSGMTSSGTVIAAVPAGAALDASSNASLASTSTDNTVSYELPPADTTPPSVAIDQAAGQADPTSGSPIVFTVVFNEAVTGFQTGDVTLSGTAGATTAIVSPAGPPNSYTVEVSGMTSSGTVIAAVPAGAAVDASSNASLASTSTDNTVSYVLQAEPEPDPLQIQMPDDMTVAAPPGESGVAVVFPMPTTTGGVPPVVVDCDHAPGEVFPIGDTIVSCTATDSAPEQLIQLFSIVSGSFTITVTETPVDGGGGGSIGGASGQIPDTGSDVRPSLLAGFVLLAFGAGFLGVARRRRARTASDSAR